MGRVDSGLASPKPKICVPPCPYAGIMWSVWLERNESCNVQLTADENKAISDIPTQEEIWQVLKKMGSLKSPGPDGMPPIFFKKCWDKVGNERLKPMLDNLVGKSQYAFVPGRLILDNILTAKELIHSTNQSNSILGAYALKIDISKAYDRVSWSFLGQCLRAYGINGDTHHELCNYSFFLCYIVNGTPEGHFGLSWMIRKMEASSLHNGYRVNKWAPSISHLMFAEDLLFFGSLDDRTLQSLQDVLFVYAKWS
ncbi:hypothetical protein C5167_006308 [Papaver somniferum]|uniref:Reverse transcriptase domain-containing protein n=1 Tax=Papaver somniferum TaxID=3469 RepID=A0A4Y7JEQ2_PAPSO|nr:hypothetical protein C5167_006308 [Papaver somniferum]